ncbi:MAG: GNAT family N-acetyltransferase [Phycisphaerales bacterium]
MIDVLTSERLEIRVAAPAELRASLGAPGELAAALGRDVAEAWPIEHWDAGAVNWMLERLGREPNEPFWRAWFVYVRNGALIGTCGCKGPPDPAAGDGVVEIGYGIVTSHRRRGFASEAARTLSEWVLRDPRVRRVRAHTLAGDPASSGVLRRSGFTFVGTFDDPSDGRIDRFERGP